MKLLLVLGTAAAALTATSVTAGITTYGDRASFNAAAGATTTETFNSCGTDTVGLGTDFVLSSANPGPCTALASGISFAPDPGYDLYIAGPGQSANIDTALGVDFPPGGNDTVSFGPATNAFGADLFQNFGGGDQSGSNALFTFNVFGTSGLLGTFTLPVASGTGGFFGLTSTEGVTSIAISQADGFAVIDNVSFNGNGTTVPEPATWALMIGGFGLVGTALRRRPAVLAA